MILLILTTVLSCSTTPIVTEGKPGAPGIEFPVFPDPIGPDGASTVVLEDGEVRMPLPYWLRIAEYYIDVEAARRKLEAWQELYCREDDKE
jgi:hypothetical protein